MKALSLKQPWAWLVVHGIKDIENRSWKTNYRGKILIHASKKYDKNAAEWLEKKGITLIYPENLKMGGIVGEVEIVNCLKKSNSKWFEGPYGFVLKNARPLPFLEMKGKLGIFDIKDLFYCKNCDNILDPDEYITDIAPGICDNCLNKRINNLYER
jgi:hypothetical protein